VYYFGFDMALKMDLSELKNKKLKKVQVQESSGEASKSDIGIYAEMYDECDGDFDLIAERMSKGRDPVRWKDSIGNHSASDGEDFAKKLLAGSLLASDRAGGSSAGILTEGSKTSEADAGGKSHK
jgi:hypothetical protein